MPKEGVKAAAVPVVTKPPETLKFSVAPHIVQDLGLNLYTDLPRVLVEFVANAYDADATGVLIEYDKAGIDLARKTIKEEAAESGRLPELEEAVLPPEHRIVITDDGHGMSWEELQDRFLVAGRRRREADSKDGKPNVRSENGRRFLMGRKGLGKLAGFGVAQLVEVVSKRRDRLDAMKITLDFKELIKNPNTEKTAVPIVPVKGADYGIKDKGTTVILSRLLYGPLQSKLETVSGELAHHFMYVDQDFAIQLQNETVPPFQRELGFAWPSPKLGLNDLVDGSFVDEGGTARAFKYRFRFTKPKKALPARDRGVRVYVHKRLAAVPSLMGADTNMHGFRMTDYLDGIVVADFIDDQNLDYVATDRQSLRWETPLLQPLYTFLSEQIKEACKQYQAVRDEDAKREAKEDKFTSELIDTSSLSGKHKDTALKFAHVLARTYKQGVDDPEYRIQLETLVRGLSSGEIASAIAKLSKEDNPELAEIAAQITALVADELDQQQAYFRTRLGAIEALRKLIEDKDFKAGKNEDQLQALFETAPWLIDATFFEFLSANSTEKTMFIDLAKELEIGKYVPKNYDPSKDTDGKRPDLVFVLGNTGLGRCVIVELKAPNLPLSGDHLAQLKRYMDDTETWLKVNKKEQCKVEGILIGSFDTSNSKAQGIRDLAIALKDHTARDPWQVFGLLEVLERTELVHRQMITAMAFPVKPTPTTKN